MNPDTRVLARQPDICGRLQQNTRAAFETSSGRELATLSPAHLAPINGGKALEFSPDGQWLLAAKHDGEVEAWNIPILRRELVKLGLNWEDRKK